MFIGGKKNFFVVISMTTERKGIQLEVMKHQSSYFLFAIMVVAIIDLATDHVK